MADFTGRLRPLLIGALLLGNGATMASPPGEVQGTSGTVGFQGALLSSPAAWRRIAAISRSISVRSVRSPSGMSAIKARRYVFVSPLTIACWAPGRWQTIRPGCAMAMPACSTCGGAGRHAGVPR